MSQNPNFFGSGMNFYDNPTTGQNFWDMTFDVTTLTGRPVIGDPSLGAYCDARALYLASLAAVTTGQTEYYFDPVGGSNANNGLTSGAPKQTVAAANTLLAAKNCRILFKRGTKDVSGTGLLVPNANSNVSIGGYGTGRRCQLLTAVVSQVTGAAWTASGTSYYMTRAAATKVAGVREQGNNYRFYAQVSTVGECQTLSGSYFHDTGANRLYVHHYMDLDLTVATDPTVLEIFPESNTNGILVSAGAGNVWIDGVEFVGYGALSDATVNACYGVHSNLTGSHICLVTNCAAVYNNNHNIGAEQGTAAGGILVSIGNDTGFLTTSGTVLVGHANDGSQQIYSIDDTILAGDLYRIAAGVPNYAWGTSHGGPWLAHTDSGVGHNPAFACAVRQRVLAGPMQCGSLGSAADCVATLDPSLIVSFNIDCVYEAEPPGQKSSLLRPASAFAQGKSPYQVGGGNPVDGFTTAYVNCRWTVEPQWMGASVDAMTATDAMAGLHINSTFLINGSNIAAGDRTKLCSFGLADAGTGLTGAYHNVHFHFYGIPFAECGMVSRSAGTATTGNSQNPLKLHLKDFIVTFEGGIPANCYLGAGNNHDAAGAVYSPSRIVNMAHNLITNSDTSRGISAVTGTVTAVGAWEPGKRPKVGDIDAAQQPLLGTAYYVRHDRFWRVRRSGTTAMGPVEAVA